MLEQLFGSRARVKILKLFLLNPKEKFYIRELSRKLKLQLNSVRRELENLERFGVLLVKAGTEEEGSKQVCGQDSAARCALPAKPFAACGHSFERQRAGKPHGIKPYGIKQASPQGKQATPQDKLSLAKAAAGKPSLSGKHEKKYYQANLDFILFEEIKALIIKSQILYEKSFINQLQKIGKVKLLILTGIFVNNFNSKIDLLIIGRVNKIKLFKLIKELENELSKEVNFTLMDTREFKYRKDVTDIFLYNVLEGKKIVVINEVGMV